MQPGEMQSALQGEAPKNTSVTLSVNEASVSFVAIDSSGKEIGHVVLSRDEYRDSDQADIRKKLFGDRKAATMADRKNEASNGEQTAAGKTAEKLGIQESVLRQKANEDEGTQAAKKDVAEKGVIASKVEKETGTEIPHPPAKPHDTSVKTPNPADTVGTDHSPNTRLDNKGEPARNTPTNPGTITHNFKLNEKGEKTNG